MVTFTKLFVMRMVANVRSESSRNMLMFLSLRLFSKSSSEMSDGERLKNAISEPLAKPETPSKTIAKTNANTTPIVGCCTYMSANAL